jgi:hypothetical protein
LPAWIALMRGCGWVVRDWISADYGRSIDLSKSTSGSFCVRLCELVEGRGLAH